MRLAVHVSVEYTAELAITSLVFDTAFTLPIYNIPAIASRKLQTQNSSMLPNEVSVKLVVHAEMPASLISKWPVLYSTNLAIFVRMRFRVLPSRVHPLSQAEHIFQTTQKIHQYVTNSVPSPHAYRSAHHLYELRLRNK